MVLKRIAFLLIFLSSYLIKALAQPTLPDISATIMSNTVVLAWSCQFNSVKAISVLRSPDSTKEYTIIGYVKNLQKGYQTFIDKAPLAGKNCYKVSVAFNSGLTWSSNINCIRTPIPEPAGPPPPKVEETAQPVTDVRKTPFERTIPAATVDNPQQPVLPDYKTNTNMTATNYLQMDEHTGHINMNLPADVVSHIYSVKFFNSRRQLISEIPRITTARLVIDRRNFHRNSFVKYILRKDGIEFGEGNLVISH